MKYLVTMEMMEDKVPTDPRGLVQHVEKVIKYHEIMIKLEKENKVLAGGGIVGKKADAFIVDAASNDELLQLIYSLPLHHVLNVDVSPLASFETELKNEREGLKQMEAAQK